MILVINSVLSAALIVLLMWLDRYEKENIVTMMKVFVLTIIATSFYAFAASMIITDLSLKNIVVIAPIMEESWKLLIFIFVIHKWKDEVNESFDPVMYIGVIALGFAFYENVTYYIAATWHGALFARLTYDYSLYNASLYSIFLARLIPGHLLFNIIAISIYGAGFKYGKKNIRLFFSWLLAILFHAAWNLTASSNLIFSGLVIFLIIAAIFSIKKLLNISEFKSEPEFGDEFLIPDKSQYDWSYYFLIYIFVIICGTLAILFSSAIESILISLF